MSWSVFGWPAVAVALAAFGVAFSTRYFWAGLVGATIAAPICLHLSDALYLHWLSLIAFGLNFVAGGLLWRGRRDIAFTLLLPFMIVVTMIVIFWFRDFPVFRLYV
jgi:hypothetical protein